jgi:hypothetical protein
VNEVFRYLGVPIGIRKIAKMKFNNERTQKVRKIIVRLAEVV